MARYLVTGGGGFIGSNIVRRIVENGDDVAVLDNFSTGRRENLTGLDGSAEVIEADIRDYQEVKNAVNGADFVIHQAALPSVQRSIQDPITSNEVNVGGTINLLHAAKEEKVKRFVFASSSSIYGNTKELPKREDMPPNPMSPYATSKMASERYCLNFHSIYGLETVCLRYFNVFGPRQDPNSHYAAVIPKFINRIAHDESPVIFGDGEQSRDFTFIDNVVRANLLACKAVGAAGQVINVACGERFTLNVLVEYLGAILEKEVHPEHDAARAGDVRHSLADISRGEQVLQYLPAVTFQEGLKRTVRWFQNGAA